MTQEVLLPKTSLKKQHNRGNGKRLSTKQNEAAHCKERLTNLKSVLERDETAIAEAEEQFAALTKAAREFTNRAEEIENAVYDLNAVNPHKKNEEDNRTPEELLALIEAKGREVTEALQKLRSLGNKGSNEPPVEN